MADLTSQIKSLERIIEQNRREKEPLVERLPRIKKLAERARIVRDHREARLRDTEVRLIERGIAEHDRRIKNAQIVINRLKSTS